MVQGIIWTAIGVSMQASGAIPPHFTFTIGRVGLQGYTLQVGLVLDDDSVLS